MDNPMAEGMMTHNLVNVAAGIFSTDPACFNVLENEYFVKFLSSYSESLDLKEQQTFLSSMFYLFHQKPKLIQML
jgi:Fe-S oxidoreductase